jgi:hypothetical protein
MKTEALESYRASKPWKYRFLKSFTLTRELRPEGASDYDLEVALASDGGDLLFVKFTGVRDLRIGSLEGLFGLHLDIRDIHASQMEGLNFQVGESEYRAFSFLCYGFTFEYRRLAGPERLIVD